MSAPSGGGTPPHLPGTSKHVVADALTSMMAILGLVLGRAYGWLWVDPLVGLIGAAVIARWSLGLMRDAGAILLDVVPDDRLADGIRDTLEYDGDRVCDLHLWRVGRGRLAVIVSLVADRPQPPEAYKAQLARFPQLSHITAEVQSCTSTRAAAASFVHSWFENYRCRGAPCGRPLTTA